MEAFVIGEKDEPVVQEGLLINVPLTPEALPVLAAMVPVPSFIPHLPTSPAAEVICCVILLRIVAGESAVFQILTSSIDPLKKPSGTPNELTAEPMLACWMLAACGR